MNADPIAGMYRWLEYASFGPVLERCRFRFLSDVPNARRALVLGDGDGRFLERLLRAAPGVEVESVDSSAAMLDLARARCGADRVQFRHEDARTCALAPGRFDLIVTHFFLDCFAEGEMSKVVGRLAQAAAPDSIWLVSEFRQPAFWARWVVTALYFFFCWSTGLKVRELADHRPMLAAAGFTLREEKQALGGLLASELWVRR